MKVWKVVRGAVLRDSSPATKLVWVYVAQHEAGSYGTLSLGEALGLSSGSVMNALAELEALGLIEVLDRGHGKSPRRLRAVEKFL